MSGVGIEDRLRTRFGRRNERSVAESTIATYTGRKIGYSKGAGSKKTVFGDVRISLMAAPLRHGSTSEGEEGTDCISIVIHKDDLGALWNVSQVFSCEKLEGLTPPFRQPLAALTLQCLDRLYIR
jgi:hypothetical protein